MRQSLFAIEAHGLQAAVAKHLHHLCILLTIFLEDEFAFFIVVLILSAPPVLATLFIEELLASEMITLGGI